MPVIGGCALCGLPVSSNEFELAQHLIYIIFIFQTQIFNRVKVVSLLILRLGLNTQKSTF